MPENIKSKAKKVYSTLFLHYNGEKHGSSTGKEGQDVEKRRVRLEINGVVCGVITQESDAYMETLAEEVGQLMQVIQGASPFITREAAALTAALSYCDDLKQSGVLAKQLQERIDELEVEADLWQEEKAEIDGKLPSSEEMDKLQQRIRDLERENTALQAAASERTQVLQTATHLEDENAALGRDLAALDQENRELKQALAAATAPKPPRRPVEHVNPMRADLPQDPGLVTFPEKA